MNIEDMPSSVIVNITKHNITNKICDYVPHQVTVKALIHYIKFLEKETDKHIWIHGTTELGDITYSNKGIV